MKMPSIRKNATINAVRQVSRLLIPLITFPYVTRVLTAENYGAVSFCISIGDIFIMIAALGLSTYAVREGACIRYDSLNFNKFASRIFSFNLLTTIISYILLLLLLFFWKTSDDYKLMIIIYSLNIISTTISVDWVFTIFEDYWYITIRGLIVQLALAVMVFCFVKDKDDYVLYLFLCTSATCIGNIINFFCSKKYVKLQITQTIGFDEILAPILILFANSAMTTIYLKSDVIMLGLLKDETQVGLYEVSVKIYTVVKTVLNAIVTVTVPRFAYYIGNNNKSASKQLASKSIKGLLVVLLPALVGLFVISENVIYIIAGGEYLGGTVALRILSIALICAVPANFIVNAILITQKREKLVLKATAISALVNVILNLIFIPWLGLNGAAITTLIAEILVLVISLYNTRSMSLDFTETKRILPVLLVGCLAVIVICLLVTCFNLNVWIETILQISISAIVYCAIIFFAYKKGYASM